MKDKCQEKRKFPKECWGIGVSGISEELYYFEKNDRTFILT